MKPWSWGQQELAAWASGTAPVGAGQKPPKSGKAPSAAELARQLASIPDRAVRGPAASSLRAAAFIPVAVRKLVSALCPRTLPPSAAGGSPSATPDTFPAPSQESSNGEVPPASSLGCAAGATAGVREGDGRLAEFVGGVLARLCRRGHASIVAQTLWAVERRTRAGRNADDGRAATGVTHDAGGTGSARAADDAGGAGEGQGVGSLGEAEDAGYAGGATGGGAGGVAENARETSGAEGWRAGGVAEYGVYVGAARDGRAAGEAEHADTSGFPGRHGDCGAVGPALAVVEDGPALQQFLEELIFAAGRSGIEPATSAACLAAAVSGPLWERTDVR